MKKSKLISLSAASALVLSLVAVFTAPVNAATDFKGAACALEGSVKTVSGVTYLCSRVNESLVYGEGRKLSGTLNVLCGAQELWCSTMTTAFQKKTGITTKFVRLSAGEGLTRLIASKNNPEFDVWHGGPNDTYIAGRIAGVLDTYKSPNRAMLIPAHQDADGYWTGVYTGALGFCSNTNELKRLGLRAPTSWADLLNPKLKGNIMMAHPGTSGTAYTTLYTQVIRLGSENAAIDYMKLLNKNVLSYTRSGAGPTGPLGRGEVAVGIVFSHDCTAAKLLGNPVVVSFPSEGTGYEVGAVGLVKGAKNSLAAKAYIDFALSAEAQNLGPDKAQSFQVLTNSNAKANRNMVNLKKLTLVKYDVEAAGTAAAALKKRFDAEVALTSSAK